MKKDNKRLNERGIQRKFFDKKFEETKKEWSNLIESPKEKKIKER